MSKIQEELLQSKGRVKLLKFLFRNGDSHTIKEMSQHIQESTKTVNSEIQKLEKIGLVIKAKNHSNK